ncbi:hypothetical protein R50073_16970 [Maricurvus nonylphenolicus]|uniref:ATP-binding protein n=1 Tax=Maricurvus nonylphenolicus TaxID=1008307 RepID=UPI0036F2E1E0
MINASTKVRKRNISIRLLLIILVLSIVSVFSALFLVSSQLFTDIIEVREVQAQEYLTSLRSVQRVKHLHQQYEKEWKNILLRGQNSETYHYHLSQFYSLERQLLQGIESGKEDLGRYEYQQPFSALVLFEEELSKQARIYRKALRAYNRSLDTPHLAAESISNQEAYNSAGLISQVLVALKAAMDAEHQKLTDEINSLRKIMMFTMIITALVMLLLASMGLSRLILKPIDMSIKLAHRIAKGNLEEHINVSYAPREVSLLIQSLELMQADIKKSQEKLLAAREEAEKSSQAKSIFLANMSHEIRTPLNGVIGLAELLKGADLDKEHRSYLEALQLSGKTLLGVINDILDYSKIISGNMVFDLQPTNLHSVLDGLGLIYRNVAAQQDKDIDFQIHVDENVPRFVMGDAIRIQQVMGNLLSNAFKFTEQGFIKVGITCIDQNGESATMEFSVADSGIGISEEAQARIFNQFEQADSSTSRQFGGTGLGLAICEKLVKIGGGRMWLESELGKGTVFSFVLTFKLSAEVDVKPQTQERELPSFSNLHVLIAEDNPVNQMVITGLMKKIQVQHTMVANGREALEMRSASSAQFDCILMDCEMPEMDGYQATQAIRQWEQEQGISPIPICALTAHSLPEQARHCIEVGMDAHLGKPIVFKDLVAYFNELI